VRSCSGKAGGWSRQGSPELLRTFHARVRVRTHFVRPLTTWLAGCGVPPYSDAHDHPGTELLTSGRVMTTHDREQIEAQMAFLREARYHFAARTGREPTWHELGEMLRCEIVRTALGRQS
jgi:hypothetical protein